MDFKDKEEIGNTLKILIEKIFKAMKEDKAFIVSCSVDDGGELPYIIGSASPTGSPAVLERYKFINKAIIGNLEGSVDGLKMLIEDEKTRGEVKITPVTREKQDGGFVKAEKSEDGTIKLIFNTK